MFISSASCHSANITLQQAEDREEEEEDTRLIKGEQSLCLVGTLAAIFAQAMFIIWNTFCVQWRKKNI